ATQAVADVRDAARSTPDVTRALVAMLSEDDWRAHLVAGVAALAPPADGAVVDAAWTAIDRGSWITPQLAVALFFIDPQFPGRAASRIAQRGGDSVRRAEGDPYARQCRTVSALLAL